MECNGLGKQGISVLLVLVSIPEVEGKNRSENSPSSKQKCGMLFHFSPEV